MATRKTSSGNSTSQLGESFDALFDVKKIRRLAELMNDHELSEIELSLGEVRLRLQRGGPLPLPASAASVAVPATAAPVAAAASTAAPAVNENWRSITSPMVGTFYLAASPENPPFVKVGDHVGPESTVCIVEAMKVFNEIPADIAGRIVAVLVENGEPVEFGQPLFKVDTSKV